MMNEPNLTPLEENREALFRFQIISPLIGMAFPRGQLKERIAAAAREHYDHPTRGYLRVRFKTIEEWYYRYRRLGFSGLVRGQRRDRGVSRTIDAAMGEEILRLKRENPRKTAKSLLKDLARSGVILPGELSPSSIYRFLAQQRAQLQIIDSGAAKRRRFEFAFINECWQGDVCHGPQLRFSAGTERRRVFLFAFIDDASRLIPHAAFHERENLQTFVEFLKTALEKRGIPERLYLDNAGYFRNSLVQSIGAQLGMKVLYCTPYSPQKKGKIERFFRNLRSGYLDGLDLDRVWTLEALNASLAEWIEGEYHRNKHASLKCTPLEAWTAKAACLRYPDAGQRQWAFLARDRRLVRRDGTVQIHSRFYEVDSSLAGRHLDILHNPFRPGKIHVFLDGTRLADATVVDPVANRSAGRGGTSRSEKLLETAGDPPPAAVPDEEPAYLTRLIEGGHHV
jgi:transposase InsO family protein